MAEGFAEHAGFPLPDVVPDTGTGGLRARPYTGVSAKPPAFASIGPHGHRQRMRERLLARGPGGLADYEILEMLLFLGIRRGDTKPLAKAAINRFGSLRDVLLAPAEGFVGLFDRDAVAALKLVVQAADRLARAEARERPTLRDWDGLDAYLASAPMGHGASGGASPARGEAGASPDGTTSPTAAPSIAAGDPSPKGAVGRSAGGKGRPGAVQRAELRSPDGAGRARLLFLNNRNQLLSDEVLAAASEDPAVLAGRTVRRALALHATALILVLGHAGTGKPGAPTKAELVLAARLKQAAGVLSITLHDVLLEDGGTRTSLRRKGML